MDKKDKKSTAEQEKALQNKMRDYFNQYKQLTQRCLKEIRQPGTTNQSNIELEGQKLYYFQPDIAFLQNPQIQKDYRRKYLSSISQVPPPPPFLLYPHQHQRIYMEIIADRSNPKTVREDLSLYFKRKCYRIQHRKHKLLQRWAHLANTPATVDRMGSEFHAEISRLQFQFQISNQRSDRLQKQDRFSDFLSPQVPHSKSEQGGVLYAENPDQTSNSAIRGDDFTSYIRDAIYLNQATRFSRKVHTAIKWIPYTKRYEIWKDSRLYLLSLKEATQNQHEMQKQSVTVEIKKTLANNGFQDRRSRQANIQRFADKLAQPIPQSKVERILNSFNNKYEKAPILIDNLGLLKSKLIRLASQFNVTGNLDLDHGHSFTYKIIVLFPHYFQMQVLKSTFEEYDNSPSDDESVLMIQARNFFKMKSIDAFDPASDDKNNSGAAIDAARKALFATVSSNAQKRLPHQRELVSGQKAAAAVQGLPQNLKSQQQQRNPRSSSDLSSKGRKSGNVVSMQQSDICITRIKQSNWLTFLCFEANISQFQQRQRAKLNLVPQLDRLLRNALDLLDVQDAAAVNAVLEQSASMHANRAKQKNPLKKDRFDITDPQSIIQNQLKEVLSTEPPLPPQKEDWRNEFKKLKKQTIASFKLLQSIPSHFIKVLYLLQHLKARDYKIRIMSYLNYFRSIQRRFALDVREFGSRDRVMADCQFIPPSTQGGIGGGQERVIPTGVKLDTQDGNNKSSGNVSLSIGGGDGNTPQKSTIQMSRTSINTASKAELTTNPEKNLVTLRKYKHNGRLSFKINSTSPILPKIHATVDSNVEIKQVSEEYFDNINGKDLKVKELNNRINKYYFTNDRLMHVVDDFGVNIYYDIALQDMAVLEDQILRIGTHYITENQIFGAMKGRLPRATLDRMVICQDLLQLEADYYLEKVKLVQTIVDSYESVCDPLEQQRVIQMVTDIMAERPCLDLQATYFKSSYKSSIQAMRFKRYFFEELIKAQHSQELQINAKMWTKMQAKCRKVAQYMDGKWRAAGQNQAMELRKKNAEAQNQYLTVNQQNDKDGKHHHHHHHISSSHVHGSAQRRGTSPGDEDGEGRKHLSKYAHQTLDFAEVLGIPNITAQSILNLQDEKEPIVLEALSQMNTYNKFKEGLPQKLHPVDQNTNKESVMDLSQMRIGFTDFYESFGIIPRVYAISVWAFEQLSTIHRPQNGAARNSLQVSYYKHCTAELKLIKSQNDSYTLDDKGMEIVTQGLVFDNPDVLQFAAKDLVSELSGDFDLMNPFHVAKLDCQSIQNYPFPEVPKVLFQYLLDGDIDETKPGIPMPPQSQQFLQYSKDKVSQKMMNIKRRKYKKVNPPSLLRVTCNIIELIRLRQQLIDAAFQTCVLHHIDQNQRKIVNKASEHPIMKDQIHFQNFSDILVENYNFVDQGHGYKTSNTQYGCLAFTQFDPSLKNCLFLRNLSASKSLFLNAGLQEFRGILTYQLMHLQTVMIAVQHNQHLMSYHQQATAQFDAVSSRKETPFITPNRVSNIQVVLSRSGDNINNQALNKQRTKIKTNLVKQVADLFILVNKKKSRSRNQVAKKLQIFHNKIAQKIKDYPKLRILRSYKIKLLHAYCKDMLRQIYHDALKVQSMEIRNDLYNSQFQMPTISPLFTHKLPLMFQNVPFQLQGQIPTSRDGMLLMNNLTSFYRLPGIQEIAKMISMNDQDARSLGNCSSPYAFNDQFDQRDLQLSIQQQMLTPPTYLKLKTNDATIFKRGDQMGGEDEDVLLLPRYKRIAYQKGNFSQAWQYGNRVFQMTRFLFYLHKLFELEMFIYKSMAGSQYQILELQQDIQRGYSFWDRLKQDTLESVTPQASLYSTLRTNAGEKQGARKDKRYEYNPDLGQPVTAEHIIQLIMMKKRKRINLSDELLNSVTGFQKMEQNILKERKSSAIQDTNEVMQLLYQKRYLSLQLALQKMVEQLRQFKDPADGKSKKKSMARKSLPIAENKQQLQRPLQHCHEMLAQLSGNTKHSTLTYSNGFNITKCTISPKYLTFHQMIYTDYQQFDRAVQPMVDQEALIPQEISLTQKINSFSLHSLSNSYFMGHIPSVQEVPRLLRRIMLGFTTAHQDNTFPANVLRQRVATRIASSEQDIQESLINLGQIKSGSQTVKQWGIQRDYTTLCILAHNVKNVMMSFLGKCMLPDDVCVYQRLQQKYKETVYWQVMAEQQRLQFIMKRQKERQSGQKSRYKNIPKTNEFLAKGVIVAISEKQQQGSNSITVRNDDKKNAENVIMSMKALISVVVNILNLEMLKASNECLSREISSLCGGLELSSKQIYALVHPQQQYASTVLQNVDKNSHLDVVQKVAPVQSFLTRLKNRCTEVQTLTSGPGLVFTLKDFNDCVRQMSKGLVKYGEIQLKSRTETCNIRILHIEHLLYCKERQNQELKRKIEKITTDQDRIVNAKIAERGNQVIYQLDQSQRELRLLKDNIFVLEMELRKALYMEYGANMRIKDVHIDNTERRFSDYKSGLTQDIKNFVLSNEKKILGNIEKIVSKFEIYKAGGGGGGGSTAVAPSRTSVNTQQRMSNDRGYVSQSIKMGSNINTPQAVKSPSPYIRQVGFSTNKQTSHASHKQTPQQALINRNDYVWPASPLIEEDIQKEQNKDSSSFIQGAAYSQSMVQIQPAPKRLQVYDQDIRQEYLMLHDYKRKLRVFWKFQFALQKSKYQEDLKRLEKQMTSNSCLWEQLAESQKRQTIIKQELMYTQQSLASCERIIDRLQSELDALQNDKLRLQQFKNNKSKRLEELEQRVRHLEVLENIDLRKVLEELRSREKALRNLANLEENFDNRIDAVERKNKIQYKQMENKYQKQEEMKKEALEKLEALRTEVKSLEGYDHTADNWKEKCRELFEICKDFQNQNKELREKVLQQDEVIRQNEIRQQQLETEEHQQQTSSIISGMIPQRPNLISSAGMPASSIKDHLQRKMVAANNFEPRRSDAFSNNTRPSTQWNKSHATSMNFGKARSQIGSSGIPNAQFLNQGGSSGMQTGSDFNKTLGGNKVSIPLKQRHQIHNHLIHRGGSPIPPIYEREAPSTAQQIYSSSQRSSGIAGLQGQKDQGAPPGSAFSTSHWSSTGRTGRIGTSSSNRYARLMPVSGVVANPAGNRSFIAAGSAIATSSHNSVPGGGKRSVSTSLKDSPSFQKMQTVKEVVASSGQNSAAGLKDGNKTMGGKGFEITGQTMKVPYIRQNKANK